MPARKRFINHGSFSKITPESAYWIGMLMADGCIAYNRNLVQLHLIDEYHIKKFQKFLECDYPVTIRATGRSSFAKKPQYIIRFTSQQIVSDLAKYGVVPRKSLIAEAKNGIENNKDFWRGVIDGNGVVGNIKIRGSNQPSISLSGTKRLLEQFRKFISYNFPDDSVPNVYEKGKNAKLFQINWSRDRVIKIINLIYKDSFPYLDRKYEKAMTILNNHNKLQPV